MEGTRKRPSRTAAAGSTVKNSGASGKKKSRTDKSRRRVQPEEEPEEEFRADEAPDDAEEAGGEEEAGSEEEAGDEEEDGDEEEAGGDEEETGGDEADNSDDDAATQEAIRLSLTDRLEAKKHETETYKAVTARTSLLSAAIKAMPALTQRTPYEMGAFWIDFEASMSTVLGEVNTAPMKASVLLQWLRQGTTNTTFSQAWQAIKDTTRTGYPPEAKWTDNDLARLSSSSRAAFRSPNQHSRASSNNSPPPSSRTSPASSSTLSSRCAIRSACCTPASGPRASRRTSGPGSSASCSSPARSPATNVCGRPPGAS